MRSPRSARLARVLRCTAESLLVEHQEPASVSGPAFPRPWGPRGRPDDPGCAQHPNALPDPWLVWNKPVRNFWRGPVVAGRRNSRRHRSAAGGLPATVVHMPAALVLVDNLKVGGHSLAPEGLPAHRLSQGTLRSLALTQPPVRTEQRRSGNARSPACPHRGRVPRPGPHFFYSCAVAGFVAPIRLVAVPAAASNPTPPAGWVVALLPSSGGL
jgi:hypothetical protein